MRILVLGDPHFTKNNLYLISPVCDEILELIDTEKPDICVCLGDTLDTHARIHSRAQAKAIRFFIAISKKCPLYVIIGNHDRENNSDFLSDVHPFVGLESYPNISIAHTTLLDTVGEFRFCFVPYVPKGRFREALAEVKYSPETSTDHPDIIFCHQEFAGWQKGNRVFTDGDHWSESLPLIVAGHIHKYQTLGQIIYTGTFMQKDYGEEPDKALVMLEIRKEKFPDFSYVSGPKDSPSYIFYDRIRLKTPPIRETVEMTLEDLPHFMERIPADNIIKGQTSGTLTRVFLRVDATEKASLKDNPHYKALQATVDKVEPKVTGKKASLAQTMVGDAAAEKSSIEDVVRELLKDDLSTLYLFETEILVNSQGHT